MAFAVLRGDRKLQVFLGGAVSSTECPIVVSFVDKNAVGETADSTPSITTGASAVDAVAPAPPGTRRSLTGFSLFNADSATVTVTVRLYVDSSTTRIVFKTAILTGENLCYSEDEGWHVTSATGDRRDNSAAADSGNISAALSAAVSVSTIVSTNLSVTASQNTSQSTNVSVALSTATSQDVSQSTNVSVALSTATSQDVSQSTNVSVALSTATSQNTSQSINLSVVKSTADSG